MSLEPIVKSNAKHLVLVFGMCFVTIISLIVFSSLSSFLAHAIDVEVTEDEEVKGIAEVAAVVPNDEDGDGMPNNWEFQYGLDPTDPSDADDDGDGDNLINLLEYQAGTDPTDFDTDNGGASDGEEYHNNCTDPLDISDDGDFECAICGDGIKVTAEECDDGNTDNGDGCNSVCEIEYCGDGVQNNNGTEECDGTDGIGIHQSCSGTCTLIDLSYCGDGIVEDPNDEGYSEECEAPDSENAACTDGGGYVGVKERSCVAATCNWGAYDACDSDEYCSDGIINGNEECDDSNLVNGDGCDNTCMEEPVCGDGIKEGAEQCDDGNLVNGDNCSSLCINEIICGDGELETGEECDDGNTTDGDLCDSACKVESVCGNSIKERGEECDDGNTNEADGCSPVCLIEPDPDDLDGDNIPDWWEKQNDLDPTDDDSNDDPDGDGLKNKWEFHYKTNPHNPDTDGDKLSDGDEVITHKTSPIKKDTDNDGLTDYDEIYVTESNPLEYDTDGGGIGDGDEHHNSTNLHDPRDDTKVVNTMYFEESKSFEVKPREHIYTLLQDSTVYLEVEILGKIAQVSMVYNGVDYELTRVHENIYSVTFQTSAKLGLDTARINISYKSGEVLQASVNINLLAKGVVSDKDSNDPLDDVEVTLYKLIDNEWVAVSYEAGVGVNPMTTDETGRYGYYVDSGTYKVIATKSGYKQYESKIYKVESQGLVNDNIYMEEMLSLPENVLIDGFNIPNIIILMAFFILLLLLLWLLVLSKKAKIQGYIYDEKTRLPVEGVRVMIAGQNNKVTITDEDGHFLFKNVNGLRNNKIIVKSDKLEPSELTDNKKLDGVLYHSYIFGHVINKLKFSSRLFSYIKRTDF